MSSNHTFLLLLLLQLLVFLHLAHGGIKKPTQLPPAELSDIKYIKCDVCKLLAKNAHSTVVRMRRDKGKGKKVHYRQHNPCSLIHHTFNILLLPIHIQRHTTSYEKKPPVQHTQLAEMDIIEAMEKLTDPLRTEGHWISRIDLQEKGSRLELIDMGKVRVLLWTGVCFCVVWVYCGCIVGVLWVLWVYVYMQCLLPPHMHSHAPRATTQNLPSPPQTTPHDTTLTGG